MGERSQGGQLRQAGVGEVPAVAGLQVLQRRQPRAVLQRSVRQVLVALPAASQLTHTAPGQALKSRLGRDGLSTRLPTMARAGRGLIAGHVSTLQTLAAAPAITQLAEGHGMHAYGREHTQACSCCEAQMCCQLPACCGADTIP